ncbi:MAG: S-layer homology domain-containing protein [Candidatus Riflebacteria bacterium]|nr:S-layer homology domain-containing protein [Candidatus Riflebacteria bacterium]
MKRFSILLIAAMLFTTVAASANPFSDVPLSHWAYDAVNTLAAKGILMGYPDGTYKGDKSVTRYAFAMVVAKMLANVEQMMEKGIGTNLVTKSDLQTLEKLTVEFADELALLGVKVTALEDDMQVVKEDVSTLKKDVEGIKDYMAKGGMEKVKLSGDMLVRHTSMIHNRDWNVFSGAPWNNPRAVTGNYNNAETTTQLRFQFKANIDENITAVARWHMVERGKTGPFADTNATSLWNNGLIGGSENFGGAGNDIDLAYLHIKDMFRFGGDFTFGRNFYATGHSLVLSDYVDAAKYYKRSGDVDVGVMVIYDDHIGSYKDNATINTERDVWALTLGTKYRDHDLYLNFFGQDEPNRYNRLLSGKWISGDAGQGLTAVTFAAPTLGTLALAGNAVANAGCQSSDQMWDVEFGSKGPIGKSGHWDYDLGFAYTNYEADIVKGGTVATNFQNIDMQGWMGHAAVKWDSKKEWAAKLAYTFGTDENVGGLGLDNDRRYDDGIETPYEDISRGNLYFRNGLMNMYDLKLQVEYRPRNTKHYFRLVGDWLDELKDTVSNDASRVAYGMANGLAGMPASFNDFCNVAGRTKTNTVYDQWNNFGTNDPSAIVLTFEYRYQLAENTRIRVGYTMFDMDGNAVTAGRNVLGGAAATFRGYDAGRGIAGDYDYNMFWAELYSRF